MILTDEQIATARPMFEAGRTSKDIGEAIGKHSDAVGRYARDHGWVRSCATPTHAPKTTENPTWSNDMIERARALAAEGFSYSEIGARMGFSKCAIVGLARRNKFPARPSPIKRDTPRKPYVRKVRVLVIPKFNPKPIVHRVVPLMNVDGLPVTRRECLWVEGERGSFVPCAERSRPGSPFCWRHAAVGHTATPKLKIAVGC